MIQFFRGRIVAIPLGPAAALPDVTLSGFEETDDDRSVFLEDFGELVIFPGNVGVVGLFTVGDYDPSDEPEDNEGILTIKTSDLRSLQLTDSVTIRGEAWAVQKIDQGHAGMTIIYLTQPTSIQ
jgi:hypothetical protein